MVYINFLPRNNTILIGFKIQNKSIGKHRKRCRKHSLRPTTPTVYKRPMLHKTCRNKVTFCYDPNRNYCHDRLILKYNTTKRTYREESLSYIIRTSHSSNRPYETHINTMTILFCYGLIRFFYVMTYGRSINSLIFGYEFI